MAQQFDRISDPLQRVGEALGRTARALGDFIRAMVEYVAAICPPELLRAAREQQALKEAQPRVRHLAYNSKKHRVQKKNINRAMREYQRRLRHDNR